VSPQSGELRLGTVAFFSAWLMPTNGNATKRGELNAKAIAAIAALIAAIGLLLIGIAANRVISNHAIQIENTRSGF
jgi:hypothetical protein